MVILGKKAIGRGDLGTKGPEMGSVWCFIKNSWANFNWTAVLIKISDVNTPI